MSSKPLHVDDHLAELAKCFVWHAEHVFAQESPLYTALARGAASDPALLELALPVPRNQPVANILFGVAHYFLLGGAKHEAADYFPSVGGTRPPADAYRSFRAFCLANADTMRPHLETRTLQTNEVRRSAYLFLALGEVARRASGRALHLIEIGASAGLCLLWDRYACDFGVNGRSGNLVSPLVLACELRGARRPAIPASAPALASRVGIDLAPADVRDADQMRWQRALIWPDQPERAERFEQAVAIARQDPPRLLAGDALEVLPAALDGLPDGSPSVVYHSFVLNQFSPEARAALDSLLKDHSRQRAIYRVGFEWIAREATPTLRLATYQAGQQRDEHLANCQQHGEWIEWLAE